MNCRCGKIKPTSLLHFIFLFYFLSFLCALRCFVEEQERNVLMSTAGFKYTHRPKHIFELVSSGYENQINIILTIIM